MDPDRDIMSSQDRNSSPGQSRSEEQDRSRPSMSAIRPEAAYYGAKKDEVIRQVEETIRNIEEMVMDLKRSVQARQTGRLTTDFRDEKKKSSSSSQSTPSSPTILSLEEHLRSYGDHTHRSSFQSTRMATTDTEIESHDTTEHFSAAPGMEEFASNYQLSPSLESLLDILINLPTSPSSEATGLIETPMNSLNNQLQNITSSPQPTSPSSAVNLRELPMNILSSEFQHISLSPSQQPSSQLP